MSRESDSRPRGQASSSRPDSRYSFLDREPVTEPIPIVDVLKLSPYRSPTISSAAEDDAGYAQTINLAVRVGEQMLRYGASSRDVEAAVTAIAAAAGLRRIELDISNQAVLLQAPPTKPGARVPTMMRVVRSSSRDFARLTAVHRLVERVVSGQIDLTEAEAELRRIQRIRRPYPRWLVSIAMGGLAMSVTGILGGGLVAMVVALVTALLVDRVGRAIAGTGIPSFYSAAAGGFISLMLAWGVYVLYQSDIVGIAHWMPGNFSSIDYAYAVSGGIVALLPGRTMTSAIEDTLTGYPVTGSGRILIVLMTCIGITIGIGGGLALTLAVDHFFQLGLLTPSQLQFASSPSTLLMQIVSGAFGAVCSAVTQRSSIKMLPATAVVGALGAAVIGVATVALGLGPTVSTGLAAIAIGFVGRLVGLRLGAPALVLAVPAMSPLLPGLTIFRGMYEFMTNFTNRAVEGGVSNTGVVTMVAAVGISLALSTGSFFGDTLAAPLDQSPVKRRRARRR